MPLPGSFGTNSASHARRSLWSASLMLKSFSEARQGPRCTCRFGICTDDIVDDAVVSGRRRAHRHLCRQQLQDAYDAAIVRTEIMSPVGDAVRLVNDEQADAVLDRDKTVLRKSRICQSFRRDKQDVTLVV